MKAVIFSGGVGTRLWPLSRKNSPKQFGNIVGDKTMIQIVVQKLFPDFKWEDIFISTGEEHKRTVELQLPELPSENILVEPATRDVGPAVGLVTALFEKKFPDEPLLLLWGSDHLVKKEDVFRKAVSVAEKIVSKNKDSIVFLGQQPRFASQNLGYIEFGEKQEVIDDIPVYAFTGFKYRPDEQTAAKFFSDGQHSWNLGYFVTTPSFLWKLFAELAPLLYKELKKIQDAYETSDYKRVLGDIYPQLEKISFDNAILEKMDPAFAKVLSIDIGWSDIGAWEALKEALSDTIEENVTKGKVMLEDSRDSLVFNYTEQMVVGIDLNEYLVINTHDVVLVCPKNSVPKIKKLVESLSGTDLESLT